MDFSQQNISLNKHELADLKKDFWQGWIGIVVVEVIGICFSFLFSSGFSKGSTVGFWFGLSPIISTSLIAVYIAYHLVNTWRDIKNGNKILITGIVSNKFVKVRNAHNNSTLTSLYERSNHYIKVNRKRYLINGRDYEICKIGSQVQMYVTPYGKRVYEIQFSKIPNS